MDDREAMRLAIVRAHAVEGRTAPRPPVGAVVVRDGLVVGQGATSPPYGPHAEVHALNEAGELAREADLYVTLEPCCVTIHTPPCTQAIMAAGIRRVVVGSLDPNPLVSHLGVTQLRAAGIEVVVGVEDREVSEIIQPFATFIRTGRPYVTAKWAMTLDGKLATKIGDAYWISGPQARLWIHNLRDRCDAILVGAGTVRTDNPSLTVRLASDERMYERTARPDLLRIVLTSTGELPATSKLLQPELAGRTCVIVGEECKELLQQQLRSYGVEVIQVASQDLGKLDFVAVMDVLAKKGLMHVLIEGGSSILGSAFDQRCIDHVAAFIAPKLVGGTVAPSPLGGEGLAVMADAFLLQHSRVQMIGEDILVEGEITINPLHPTQLY